MKGLLNALPPVLQRPLRHAARQLVDGRLLYDQQRACRGFEGRSVEGQKAWILDRTLAVVRHALTHNPFYRDLYRALGIETGDLRTFEDLAHLPVVTKEQLRAAGGAWLRPDATTPVGNTGGTSGSPLQFCSSREQGVRERFYMARVWARVGCTPCGVRAVFRGVNLGQAPWVYQPQDAAFFVNTYRSYAGTARELETLFTRRRVAFLHGYPSSIYQFALYCLREEAAPLRRAVVRHLKGILLGSEYPAPPYRHVIETAFPVPSVSWYGHSEKVVLAAERGTPGVYEPFQSYGHAEAVPAPGGGFHLVGTSFDNYHSPFIRYDTGDGITPEQVEAGLLRSFRIRDGRLGEFILDHAGHPVSLTALIFGRHHAAFARGEFIQVSQDRPGHAVLHVTCRPGGAADEDLRGWFDLSNVAMTFDVVRRSSPWRTPGGKVPLLIPAAADVAAGALETPAREETA